MHSHLTEFLKCVHDDYSPLELHSFKPTTNTSNLGVEADIESGILFCPNCKRWYPIIDYIPRLMPDALRSPQEDEFFTSNAGLLPDYVKVSARNVASFTVTISEEEKIKKHEIVQRDAEAGKYHEFCTPYTDRVELSHILKYIDPKKEDRILEVAAGTGRITSELAEKCNNLFVTDFSITSLQLLKKCTINAKNIHMIQCDACALPFKPESFNKVVNAQMLEHIPTHKGRESALFNMINLLQRDGTLAMTVYNYGIEKKKTGIPKEGHHTTGIFFYNFTKSDILGLLQSKIHNITVKRISGLINYWPKKELFPDNIRYLIDSLVSKTPISCHLSSILLVVLKKTGIQANKGSNYQTHNSPLNNGID